MTLDPDYLPPQVVEAAQERYIKAWPENSWLGKVPNFQDILNEEYNQWKQLHNLSGN